MLKTQKSSSPAQKWLEILDLENENRRQSNHLRILDQQQMRPSKWILYHVGIYKVSSLDQKPKVIAHKQITNQYTSIITLLKPSKKETVHGPSQHNHFRKFINRKRKFTYVSLINGYWKNDPPCSLNRDHVPIGC